MPVSLEYDEYDLGSKTWEMADDAFDDAEFVVLPCGSIEQHSLHLPVTVDTLRAEHLTQKLAETALEYGFSMLRLPTLPYGYSEHHMNYPGTVTLKPDTYRTVIEEIGESIAVHGADRLVLINFHGGNREPLKLASDRIQRDHNLPTYFIHWTEFARDQLEEMFGEEWGHAGEYETSLIELFYPDLVHQEKKVSQTQKADFETRQYSYFNEITEQGGLGDPTKSDPELLEQVVADTTARILQSLKSDLEEERGDE
jgi:creatinine amidohydrolase